MDMADYTYCSDNTENYCNRQSLVQVVAEKAVTCFFRDTV